jgi:hypothetical protein
MAEDWARGDWERLAPLLRDGTLRPGRVHGADWTGLDLRYADLSDCQLFGVDLTGADLTRANLVGAKLMDGCTLAGAKLVEARFEEADLSRCELKGAKLTGAKYSAGTRWPEGFALEGCGLILQGNRAMSCRSYTELWTEDGQCHAVSVDTDYLGLFRRLWRTAVRSVRPMTTQVTTELEHGWYAGLSRYRLKKLKYAGCADGYPGFTEALEIEDPPNGRGRGVLYNYDGRAGSWFAEFNTPLQAERAYERWWGQCHALPYMQEQMLSKLFGFRRFVQLGPLTPWFYALGNEQLYTGGVYDRDVVLPDWLCDHPTYRLGSWWLVTGYGDVPRPVQCLGALHTIEPYKQDGWREVNRDVVRVYWSDGTSTVIGNSSTVTQPMRPDQSAWMAKAHQWLDELLSGRRDHVVLDALGGQKLTMRVGPSGKGARREGTYKHEVVLDQDVTFEVPKKNEWGEPTEEMESRSSRVFNGQLRFKPTAEYQTPEAKFRATMAEQYPGVGIVRLQMKLVTSEKDGQRWSGIFWGDTPMQLPPPVE